MAMPRLPQGGGLDLEGLPVLQRQRGGENMIYRGHIRRDGPNGKTQTAPVHSDGLAGLIVGNFKDEEEGVFAKALRESQGAVSKRGRWV